MSMSNINIPLIIMLSFFIIAGPIILFIIEYRLAKKESKFAIILPVIVMCFAVIIPIIAITGIIMFVIYFVVKNGEKERKEKISELEKMNIQDLE